MVLCWLLRPAHLPVSVSVPLSRVSLPGLVTLLAVALPRGISLAGITLVSLSVLRPLRRIALRRLGILSPLCRITLRRLGILSPLRRITLRRLGILSPLRRITLRRLGILSVSGRHVSL